MKKIHLLCNAHLDPVWLWEWEEGAAEAISTFRVAADFCEEFEGFVFNHNEVILYRWVEEYEPELFKRIQRLVAEGKWHIMGGWYLQPDCNMPSGESFVRQILTGRTYFNNKFGVWPTTAINFDPFGHTRCLVQIMKKSGYDSYVFCRPRSNDCSLPAEDFIWVGYDGSEIMGHRTYGFYLTARGEADKKIKKWIEENPDKECGLLLWGIGNHGGGPSRLDLEKISVLKGEMKEYDIIHSTPEAYFDEIKTSNVQLPRHEKDLNAWAAGCYTSQIRIKQKHRLLENEIYMLEKMMSSASMQNYLEYPREGILEALYDLMFSEFHDTLPGTSIQPVEEAAIRLLDHGLEITSRLKARAFFSLATGQEKAKDGEIPIMVYNPHPYPVKGIFECEFQLADQNWKDDEFTIPHVYQEGEIVPCQTEKEYCNMPLDWRKHVVFAAELKPSQMNRFDCRLEVLPKKPKPGIKEQDGKLIFDNGELEVEINLNTGLMDKYSVSGVNYLKKNAFLPIVIDDDEDPWGMNVKSFRNIEGAFKLMWRERGTFFSGVRQKLLDSVRVIEEGEVRSVVEAVFAYGDSFICQTYKIPKQGTEIEVQVRVHWNEKDKMLKLSIPTLFEEAKYMGQVAYGVEELLVNGNEEVAQKWTAAVDESGDRAFTCINNGTYASDFCEGEIRLSLLRSPGYSAHPIKQRTIMEQDRYSPRIDQGERLFNFWFKGGSAQERITAVDCEAALHNEKPFALSFFPHGGGRRPMPSVVLSDAVIQMNAFKKAESSEDYILRIFNPTGQARNTEINIPCFDMTFNAELNGFEIKTYKLDIGEGTIVEVDLMERI